MLIWTFADIHNIIFSGKFGMGKSFFLNQFFNKKFREKYVGLFITPVNYSVANNEDIFEYIKVDILMQLMEKVPCDFDKFDITSSVAAYYYLQNNLFNFISNILAVAEKVNYGTDIFQALIKFKNRIESFKKQNSVNDKQEVFDFIKEIEYKKGSIYESDIITQIIQYLINEAKKSLGERKVVLIIDDLDRIDPEHIFRILNVLSAHDDFCMSGKHKFNVDQTILVCDIDNIRKIFHARYGAGVDFSGYIDKFYSKEIYRFMNERRIIYSIGEMLSKISNNNELDDKITHTGLVFILKNLINNNLINIKTLLKFEFNYENIATGAMYYYGLQFYSISNSPAITIFQFLERISGSPESLKSKLFHLSKIENFDTIHIYTILEIFIILADIKNNRLIANTKFKTNYKYKNIKYNFNVFDTKLIANIEIYEHRINLNKVIYDAYLNYKKFFFLWM